MSLKKLDKDDVKLVSLEHLSLSLAQRKFSVIELFQKGRHIHGGVDWQGERAFIKIGSSPGVSQATRNEVRWNQWIRSQGFRKGTKKVFFVPKIFTSGRIGNLWFLISEYCPGQKLYDYEQSPSSPRRLLRELPHIVEALLLLDHQPPRRFAWDRPYLKVKNPARKFFQRSLWYQKELQEEELSLDDLMTASQDIENCYHPSISHGDFTPWHMIAHKGERQFALIDGEMACSLRPRFYDAAFFYQRLYTGAGLPKVSKLFAQMLREAIPKGQRHTFDRTFHAILAERVLGSYWDALQGRMHGEEQDFTLQRKFHKDLVKKNIY